MAGLIKKPLFWTNLLALVLAVFVVAPLAFGWTNPVAAPPGGSGAISVDANGRVGIGNSSPLFKLDVAGAANIDGVLSADQLTVNGPASVSAHLTVNDSLILNNKQFRIVTGTNPNCPAGYRVFSRHWKYTYCSAQNCIIQPRWKDTPSFCYQGMTAATEREELPKTYCYATEWTDVLCVQ